MQRGCVNTLPSSVNKAADRSPVSAIPAKLSGCLTLWAMRVIEIVEVFDARIAPGGSTFCTSPNNLTFASSR